MAVKQRAGRFLSRLHFLVRFVGLTGLVVGCVGLVLAGLQGLLSSWPTARDAAETAIREQRAELGTWLVLGGAAAVLFALLVEALVILRLTAARRSAFGLNAVVQVALAAALLVGVNVWSFRHYLRFDWTRSEQFTLPADLRARLAQLDRNGKTTIVVYQRHKTFGALTDKPDRYDYAAERKVVEKVKDLVEQFREAGPQFQVVVLDVEEEGFDDKLAALTRDAPQLRHAIESAPENSIFFHGRRDADKTKGEAGPRELVQQLSFNEFYRLDKTASQEQNNLVLLAQGAGKSGRAVEPFARKILNLEERRPRVGVAVIHEWLTTRGTDTYGLIGLKNVLAAHGFDVRDIVLKDLPPRGLPKSIVSTWEERRLDELDQRIRFLDFLIRRQEEAEKALAAEKRENDLDLADVRLVLDRNRKHRADLVEERGKLDVDALREQQRMSDLHGKLTQLLADCDLLIVPRPTLYNVAASNDRSLPIWLHNLDEEQFAAIRDFLKSGKPVLVCVGPPSELPNVRMPPGFVASDDLENLLSGLGIRFGKQAVLFDAENEAFSLQRLGGLTAESTTPVPPLALDWPAGAGRPSGLSYDAAGLPPHPIRNALSIAARSLGHNHPLELRLRHPRPIYYQPPKDAKPGFDPEFLMTGREAWNEEKPFPTDDYTPAYKRTPDDPNRGTLDERRRGPFPVGVALQTAPPADWYGPGEPRPAALRVAAVGESWFLIGPDLNPAKERLVLDTCNWLLGRDDALPRGDHPWSYPRSNLTPGSEAQQLWLWGTRLGLPVLFAWLGLVVLLVRRLR
jgi:hypothetical protein